MLRPQSISSWNGVEVPLDAKELEDSAPPYEPTSAKFAYEPKDDSQQYVFNGARPVNAGFRPKNVILFGETGVGKSSVINLLVGKELAKISSGLEGCTMEACEYSFTFPGPLPFRIFDTVGLDEPDIGLNTFLGAIQKAHELIKSLHGSGGVDLLLFCVRGGRVTASMQQNYKLFSDILCGGSVPLAIVVTSLEQEEVMEDWWVRNQAIFKRYNMRSVAHACITSLPASATLYAQKRAQSQRALRIMLHEALDNTDTAYVQESHAWFVTIIQWLRSIVKKHFKFFWKRELMRKLENECKIPHSDAQVLAQMLSSS